MAQFKTGRGRCPVNGSKRWSYLGSASHPDFIISYGASAHEPTYGWVHTGESDSGGQMFVREKESSFHESYEAASISIQPDQLDTLSDSTSAPIDPAIKHRVYQELLSRCRLNASHRSHLVHRKLPFGELCRLLSFGSLPHPSKRPGLAKQIVEALDVTVKELLQIPGFFTNDKGNISITGSTGLLVPAFDTKGRIQALQIRKDSTNKGDHRYIWMSSASKNGEGSGAPACFLGDRHSEITWITEGAIKGGALITKGWADAAITVPGVGNIEGALQMLDELEQTKQAVVVFDCDWRKKPGVLKALARLLKAIMKRGIPVEALSWDPSWGKGIDDAIANGMQQKDMYTLPVDGILRAAQKVTYANPRLQTEDRMPIWEPSAIAPPTIEELRTETSQVVSDALRQPAGTVVSVGANTSSGKTHAVNHHSPPQTVLMYRNYGALEEAEREKRQVHEQGQLRVLYGRIAPPDNPNDANAQRRYERAGCPNYKEMKQRSDRGHSPCQGCPLAPAHRATSGSEDPGICAYWKQRFKTIEEHPDYLLAVPQSIASNPDLLQLLPKEETIELFGEYERLVIDDCPEFIQHLTRESSISISDVKQWRAHPGLKDASAENQLLLQWLQGLLHCFADGSPRPLHHQQQKELREWSTKIAALPKIICEEPIADEELLPLRAIHSLAAWIARGGDIRFEGEGEQRRLFYLRPANELLEHLKRMTICHLDATPDDLVLAWFANLTGMNFKSYKMKRRFPPIIQIPDVLWDRDQVKDQKALIRALTEHIHDQGGIVLGFKNREGEEEDHLPLDGHWGYSERGFNCFSGVSAMALIGHFSLPIEEIKHAAWQMRELSRVMGKALPDTFVQETFASERMYSDPWRPFSREMHVCEDRLVEHMRRHRHTASVVQGANRPRNFGAPVYLLDGEPLDGLPWEVPVELWTREELVQELGLELGETHTKQRVLNHVLEARNEQRKADLQERIQAMMPGARAYMDELGRLPGIRELRRFLAPDGGMVKQELAYLVRENLVQLDVQFEAKQEAVERIDNSLERQGEQGDFCDTEWGVPHYHLNSINTLRAEWGTPHSVAKKVAKVHDFKKENEIPRQPSAKNEHFVSNQGPRLTLTREELTRIPPLARVRLGLCDFGMDSGWNDDLIRQVARHYELDRLLLYRFIGVLPRKGILPEPKSEPEAEPD